MTDKAAVHKERPPGRRVPRGVRMAEDLWAFVDAWADLTEDGNASRLIEKWVSEKRTAMREAA